jgi:hypothetical protein
MQTVIELVGEPTVTGAPANDVGGERRVRVYFGEALVLVLTPDTADQLGDALADAASAVW